MSNYIKYGSPVYIESWERDFRERWSKEANEKNDRIVGDGYADRQIADTLSKVDPINTNISRICKNMEALIKRGDAVDILAEYFPEVERNQWREVFAEILNRVPDVKTKRGQWIRDSDADRMTPGLRRYFCSVCTTYNDTRSNYCPYCGAVMRVKR